MTHLEMMPLNHGPLSAPPLDLLISASIFLDFDGTLVPLVDRPDAVRINDNLRRLLDSLFTKLDGRLAIVTGRGTKEASNLFGAPKFPIAGSHGLEIIWPDGRKIDNPGPTNLDQTFAPLQVLKERFPSVLIEMKPYGVALHYRLAPEAEEECAQLALALASKTGLTLQPGKMVFELRSPGANKGSAVATLMAEPSFLGTRPLFIGDDATDEAGFGAATRLGGAGILVGPERPTLATHRLDDVEGVLLWLRAAIGVAQ